MLPILHLAPINEALLVADALPLARQFVNATVPTAQYAWELRRELLEKGVRVIAVCNV